MNASEEKSTVSRQLGTNWGKFDPDSLVWLRPYCTRQSGKETQAVVPDSQVTSKTLGLWGVWGGCNALAPLEKRGRAKPEVFKESAESIEVRHYDRPVAR